MTYSLPSFNTELGDQNLNRMALPPGPDDLMQESDGTPGEPAFPPPSISQTAPDAEIPASAPDVPEPTQQTTIEPSTGPAPAGDVSGLPPAAPEPVQQPGIESPPQPEIPPGADNSLPLAELDAFLAAAGKLDDPPTGVEAPPLPSASEPAAAPTGITMQCHACSNTYTAEISQFPVIVTCPFCQAQGMIESLPGH